MPHGRPEKLPVMSKIFEDGYCIVSELINLQDDLLQKITDNQGFSIGVNVSLALPETFLPVPL